jgi:predicted regulator of Ras-like GTPase activity (Roadblock/LC7/MglB family)
MSKSNPADRLDAKLSRVATDHAVPSLVVADRSGLVVASAGDDTQAEGVAALTALRASGDQSRAELASGRVKSRPVDIGDDVVLLGAIGDTAICSAVFDEAEEEVKRHLA